MTAVVTLRAWWHTRWDLNDERVGPAERAAYAAERTLAQGGLDRARVAAVIFVGALKEHPSWTAALDVQRRVGAAAAMAFDATLAGCDVLAGWRVASNVLRARSEGALALVAGASQRGLAGAVVLERGGHGIALRAARVGVVCSRARREAVDACLAAALSDAALSAEARRRLVVAGESDLVESLRAAAAPGSVEAFADDDPFSALSRLSAWSGSEASPVALVAASERACAAAVLAATGVDA